MKGTVCEVPSNDRYHAQRVCCGWLSATATTISDNYFQQNQLEMIFIYSINDKDKLKCNKINGSILLLSNAAILVERKRTELFLLDTFLFKLQYKLS